jgi:hypothetical protein
MPRKRLASLGAWIVTLALATIAGRPASAAPLYDWMLLGLAVSAAEAVMPPYVYKQARDEATYHVQVRVTRVVPPAATPGDCETAGEVVRIFRDKTGELRPGTPLTFAVSCKRPGDATVVGGTLWTDHDTLVRAKYVEAFLNRVAGRYQVALWQSRIIDAPTDKPAIGPSGG